MKFIQNTNRLINILYQNKTGTQKRQTNNCFFFFISDNSCIYLRSSFANMFTPSSPFTLQTCLLIPQTIWCSDLGGYRPPERFPISPTNFVIQKFKDRGDICAMSTVKSCTSSTFPYSKPSDSFASTLFERAHCHFSNIFKLHFVLFLVFWGVVSRNQAASSSAFFGLRKRDPSMLAITCEWV